MKLLVAIVGPTAVGKTNFSFALAQHFQTAIISADSRQVYREMTIGTAKPDEQMLRTIPHYFINHVSINTHYNAGIFAKEAFSCISKIFETKNIVFLCGGSGLYLKALYEGMHDLPSLDSNIRTMLTQLLQEKGISALQHLLLENDAEYYQQVDLQNPHRLIRALEICLTTQQPYSNFLKKSKEKFPFELLKIGLLEDRTILYQKINQRVDEMIQAGFLKEVQHLYPHKNLKALQTVGYQEMFDFLENKTSFDEAVNKIKQHTRNFAKRQMTWFRKETDIHWMQTHDIAKAIDLIEKKWHT